MRAGIDRVAELDAARPLVDFRRFVMQAVDAIGAARESKRLSLTVVPPI